MSYDFDFEFNFSPQKTSDKINPIIANNSNANLSSGVLSLKEKLNLLKQKKNGNEEKNQNNQEEYNKSNNENYKEQKLNNNLSLSNIHNLISKIKSNKEDFKKQASIVSEKRENFLKNSSLYESEPKNNINEMNNIIDNVKINENFNKEFHNENGFSLDLKKDNKFYNINNSISPKVKNNINEENNQSGLDLSDSIQEIEDIFLPDKINEPSPKKSNIKIGQNGFFNDAKVNVNMLDSSSNFLNDTNNDIKKKLENLSLFKNKRNDDIYKIDENNPLDLLLSSNIPKEKLGNIQNFESEKDNQKLYEMKNFENSFNSKVQQQPQKKIFVKLDESVGSFDRDSDEEKKEKKINEDKDNENSIENNNITKSLVSINKNEIVRDLIPSKLIEKERNENLSLLNNPQENIKSLNNNIYEKKNDSIKFDNIVGNNIQKLIHYDSGISDLKKNYDLDNSENLVNLSKEIQEYTIEGNLNVDNFHKINNEIDNSKFPSFVENENINVQLNKSNVKNLSERKLSGSLHESVKKSFVEDAKQEESFRLIDNILESDKELNLKESNRAKVEMELEENKGKELTEEIKDIKNIFKMMKDESDDEIQEKKDLKSLPDKNISLNNKINMISLNDVNINAEMKKNENFITKLVEKDLNSEKKTNIEIDDDIPEIEDHEDGIVVNLDKVDLKKNESNFKNDNFFNLKLNSNINFEKKNNYPEEIKKKSERDIPQNKPNAKIEEISKLSKQLEDANEKKVLPRIDKSKSEKISQIEKEKDKNESKFQKNQKISSFREDSFDENNKIKTEDIIEIGKDKSRKIEYISGKDVPQLKNETGDKKLDKLERNSKNANIQLPSKPSDRKKQNLEKSDVIFKSEESINSSKIKNKPNKEIDISHEIFETEVVNEKEKRIVENPQKKEERIQKRKESEHQDFDRISVSSNDSDIDSSKYKIFIDFNIDPEKNETHLNEILGKYFDERVREKNIRFLLRRKSIVNNELFTSFTLREFNIINKIKKLPFDYSSKVEQILNEYQNDNDFDNLFKKAIGDDNNNKQNLMRLLEKDKIKDKSFFLFDNISCLFNIEAFAERFDLSNEKFDMTFQPGKVLKNSYDEEEIVSVIYSKKENTLNLNVNNNINNAKRVNTENNMKTPNEDNFRINTVNDAEDSKVDEKNKKNISQTNSKNISNDNIFAFNLINLQSEIKCWRESVSDGDSFYRMFMFGIIEYNILNRNSHEIKKILFDVNRVYESNLNKNVKKSSHLFTTRKIDYSKVVIIFNLIIEALKNNQIEKAYDVLLNAYNLEDKSFDLVLIGYMRVVMWKLILEFSNSTDILTMENKFKTEKLKKDYEEVNFETINTFQLEPFKLSFNLASLIFGVNLEIIYLDSIPHPSRKNEKVKCSKIKFNLNLIHEAPTITLLYNFNCFGKYYTHSFYEKNKNILGKYYSNNFKKVVFEENYTCERCSKNTKKVIFKKYEYSSCYTCLKNHLNAIIFERVKYYEIENFISREFYCRPVTIKQKFNIDDFDFLSLYGCTLASYLMDLIRKCCFHCDDIKIDEQIFHLDCSCNYCKTCLQKKMEELTNGNYVLNTFEKNIYFNGEDQRKTCGCNTIFDIDSGLTALGVNLELYKRNANKRLDDVCLIFCLKCGANKMQNQDQNSSRSNLNFVTLKIVYHNSFVGGSSSMKSKSNEIEVNEAKSQQNEVKSRKNSVNMPIKKEDANKYISYVDHVICNNCIDDHSRALLGKPNPDKNKKNINSNNINYENNSSIFCNICENDHIIDMKSFNKIAKKKACCQGGCEMF